MALFLAVLLLVLRPALAFDPAVLDSVVSVLPHWPGYDGGRVPAAHADEPEGSGVAVRPGGYVATALHVVAKADRIMVRLHDGLKVPAKLVGRDRSTDLALLHIPRDLPVLRAGPPPALGAPVCAVGNPFGLDLSVSCGVVSATGRSGIGFNAIEDFLQTDAAVNPGASGGALVDGQGRLVGLLSAIFTKESDSDIGVNFAVSLRLLDRVVDDLRARGKVDWPVPGFALIDLRPEEDTRLTGARVLEVEAGSAAHRAGLRQGDVVTHAEGRPLRGVDEAMAAWYMKRRGETLQLSLRRGEGRVEVTVAVPE